jgi:ABC-type transporter MlaC component
MTTRARERQSTAHALLRTACVVATLALILAQPLRARAETKSPADFVQNLLDDAWQCAARKDLSGLDLIARIARYVDIEHMARTALGSPWEQLGAGERGRYLRAYRDLFQRVAAKYCAAKDVVLEKLGSRRSGGIELVAFRVRRSSGEHDIYWYVRTGPRYAVVDIAINGVLVTERQRREFEVIIRAHDGDLTALPDGIDRLQP